MRQIIIVLFMVATSASAKSQVLLGLLFGDKLNSEKMSFGIHLDYSWNNMTETPGSKTLKNFNLGLFFNRHLNETWHINVEALFKYKRGAKNLQLYDLGNDSLNLLFRDGHVNRFIKYLTIPVSVQYVLKPGIYFELGPQVSFRTKALDVFKIGRDEGVLKLEKDIRDNIHRWDFGWLAGIGYRLGKAKDKSVGIRYNGGFSDVVKSETGNQVHQQWGVYANIPMGKKKSESKTK